MKTVNTHQAKTQLSSMLKEVESGGEFVIARAGKPVARLVPIEKKAVNRIGFLQGKFEVPDDFNTFMADEIADMFEGKYDGTGLFEKGK
jgi:prevent-host-death family protein